MILQLAEDAVLVLIVVVVVAVAVDVPDLSSSYYHNRNEYIIQ